MPLFDDKERVRQAPLQRGERLFAYYDGCARNGFDDFRGFANAWLTEMPEPAQAELIARVRNGTNRDFHASLFEIAIHAALIRLGHNVVVHPPVPNSSRRPDFRADHPQTGNAVYVEATTINPPREQDAERNREDPVYNAIDRLQLPPGCMLGYRLIQAGSSSPPLREVIRSVEEWARANADAAVNGPIERVFEFTGWVLELELFAGGSGVEPSTRAIGVVSFGAGWIAPHQDLRSTLESKCNRYGSVNAPFLIAVADAREELLLGNRVVESTLDALLGDEAVEVADGQPPTPIRLRNGFWFAKGQPRNRQVSGVLVIPSAQLWSLRRHPPILAINPWAEYPLPRETCSMRSVVRDGDRWALREDANTLADILQLPLPWPPDG
jgi:hypothetical protein